MILLTLNGYLYCGMQLENTGKRLGNTRKNTHRYRYLDVDFFYHFKDTFYIFYVLVD